MNYSIKSRIILHVFFLVLLIQICAASIQYFQTRNVYVKGLKAEAYGIAMPIFADLEKRLKKVRVFESTGHDFMDMAETMISTMGYVQFPFIIEFRKTLREIKFVSPEGWILAHPDETRMFQKIEKISFPLIKGRKIAHIENGKEFQIYIPYTYSVKYQKEDRHLGGIILTYGNDEFEREIDLLLSNTLISMSLFILIGGFGAWMIAGSITKPIFRMADFINELSLGKLSKRISDTKTDEMGTVSKALDRFVDQLETRSDLAESVAKGDLTREVKLASDEDVLGLALRKMTKNLSSIVRRVVDSATLVTDTALELSAVSIQISQSSAAISTQADLVTDSAIEICQGTAGISNNMKSINEKIGAISKARQHFVYSVNDTSSHFDAMLRVLDKIARISEKANDSLKSMERILNGNPGFSEGPDPDRSSMVRDCDTIIAEEDRDIVTLTLKTTGRGGRSDEKNENPAEPNLSKRQLNRFTIEMESLQKALLTILHLTDEQSANGVQVLSGIVSAISDVEDVSNLLRGLFDYSSDAAKNAEGLKIRAEEVANNISEVNLGIIETMLSSQKIGEESRILGQLAKDLDNSTKQFRLIS